MYISVRHSVTLLAGNRILHRFWFCELIWSIAFCIFVTEVLPRFALLRPRPKATLQKPKATGYSKGSEIGGPLLNYSSC